LRHPGNWHVQYFFRVSVSHAYEAKRDPDKFYRILKFALNWLRRLPLMYAMMALDVDNHLSTPRMDAFHLLIDFPMPASVGCGSAG
jgi:hypothetical protein